MECGIGTFEMIAELELLAERAFVFKLREQNPLISADEVEARIQSWYKDRPAAEFGDGEGRVGDISRFKRN